MAHVELNNTTTCAVADLLLFFFSFLLSPATLVAQESGRDVLEFNASDARSKVALREQVGDLTGSHTLELGLKKKTNSNKSKSNQRTKRCVIMDEVDGMGGGDRSGLSELIQMIKTTKVPIICICNDRQSQKLKSLVPYCYGFEVSAPHQSSRGQACRKSCRS